MKKLLKTHVIKFPLMEAARLLQASLTRARHFSLILSNGYSATLNVIFEKPDKDR